MSLIDRSEVVPIRNQRVPQSIETPVTFVSAPGAYVRYTYSRSGDSMASHIEGQDYLCFQHNDQRFVFVVCDGVGSSFCGNLAARILGDGLLEWLWSVDVTYLGSAAALSEAAASALNRLQKQARHEVEEYKIPDQISPLVRQALEAQRAYGSEAVFVALRVDHPSAMIPDGLISLCWMGDSQMHVFDHGGDKVDVGGSWDNANRWSSTQGVRGHMSAWMRELSDIGRIVAFTDGLAAHSDKIVSYSDDRLDREIRAGAKMPTSDDVSLIDVVLRTAHYEGYPDPDLPDPNLERPVLEQIWNPTGAGVYELRWNWPGQPNASFMIQEATNPALTDARMINVIPKNTTWKPDKPQTPGHYYYRVRAINRRGVVTPWSELRQTRVAYPPPPAPGLQPVAPGTTPSIQWEAEGEALDYALELSKDRGFEEPEVVYTGRNASWTMPIGAYSPGIYYFRVQAISDGGASPWSEVQDAQITLPPPPRPHLAAASFPYGGTGRSYELRWQPVPGATRYELEEHEQDTGQTATIAASDPAYLVADQPEGHYVYRVRACHDYGCSEWSNEQTVIISAQPPGAAPLIEVEGPDQNGEIRLGWAALETAAEYEIEISQDDTFHSARVYTTDRLVFGLTRHEPGVIFFRARGANSGGPGPWSAPLKVAVSPRTPEWIEVKPSADGRLSVSWASAGSRLTYCLEIGAPDAPGYSEVYRGEDTQVDLRPHPLQSGVSLRVRAEASAATSDWRTSDPLVVEVALPAPNLEMVEENDEGIQLRWNAIPGATHYFIETARNPQFTEAHRQQTDKVAALFHPPSSGQYWFRVRACQGERAGGPSNIVSFYSRRPTAPHIWPLDPVKENALFDISWTGVPGCAHYELQGSTGGQFEAGKTTSVRINHPSQKFTVPGRSRGVYYYRVRAFDDQEQASLWSETLAVEVV